MTRGERQRRYRERRREGRIVLHLEVDAVDLIEKLLALGHIAECERDDLRAIEAAVQAHGSLTLRDA